MRFRDLKLIVVLCLFSFWSNVLQACWLYRITLNGAPGFFGLNNGAFFVQDADLIITTTITPESQTTNGVNLFDMGIFTINANPLVGEMGALYFATNTSLPEFYLQTVNQGSAIDLAFVNVEPSTREIFFTLDGDNSGLPLARLGTYNIYNLTSGVTAQIHNVLTGSVNLQFNEDFTVINGDVFLGGSSGFGGPFVSSEYRANFNGFFRQNLCQ